MGAEKVHVVLAIVLICFNGLGSSVLVEDVRDEVIRKVEDAWTQLKGLKKGDDKPIAQTLKDLAQILSPIPESISRVEKEYFVDEYEATLKSLESVKNTSVTWRNKKSEIFLLIAPIEVLYGHFKLFTEMPEAFLSESGNGFSATSLSDLILKPLYNTDDKGTITLRYLIENAHTQAVTRNRREKDAFHILRDHIDDSLRKSYWCLWNGKTPQRIIYGLYDLLATYDIKEYVLLNFAWIIRYSMNSTENAHSVREARTSLYQRTEEKAMVAKDVMARSSSAYWRCDPIKYQEGVNYDQFKELLQGYIENESRMHPSGSCKQSCTDFTYNSAVCSYPDEASCIKHRVCTGNLVDCKFISADATVCPADAPRRFDYIEYKRGPTLGKTEKCKKPTFRKDSHWRFLYHCSNCFCLCDDPQSPTTVRHVSLLPVVSDVAAGKVVTGVRLIMKDAVLNFQIEQGTPAKEGAISEGSTEWKEVSHVEKRDGSQAAMLEYFKRGFDLDDLVVPKEHVLTGVKFRLLGAHLNLEIQATQINPKTGKLISGSSHWISNDNTPEANGNSREKLELEEADVPTQTQYPSIPDSVHDQYLEFGPSSRYKDVSQTTIPFIDIQPVRPTPPVWLRGVGIFHKGQPGYGGFIAPRVFTTSIVDFVKVSPSIK